MHNAINGSKSAYWIIQERRGGILLSIHIDRVVHSGWMHYNETFARECHQCYQPLITKFNYKGHGSFEITLTEHTYIFECRPLLKVGMGALSLLNILKSITK